MKLVPQFSHFLQVPKNILLAITDFDYFEWTVIFELLFKLQEKMTLKHEDAVIDDLPEIWLAYTDISGKNIKRDNLYERLAILRSKNIQYRLPIPGSNGRNLLITTGLFSSVIKEEKGGGVYVKVTKEAIPWLIALERGYSLLETQIFKACPTIYVRRLYLYICSKMIQGNAVFKIPVNDIKDIQPLRIVYGLVDKARQDQLER